MFGYVSVKKEELLVKEYETFRAYYCGLCRFLAAYGQKARLLLNYDCTFLYLLGSALAQERPDYQAVRCAAHPTRKTPRTLTAGGQYAAAVNILLGYYSLKDHAQDRKNPFFGVAAGVYRRALKKAAKQYPAAAQAAQRQMQAQAALEQQGCSDIDQAADASAQLLSELFLPLGSQKKVLSVLGYHIGRYIYLIDAADDLLCDAKAGSYNPFLQRFGQDREAIEKSVRFHLLNSAAEAGRALDLLELKRYQGILENIIYKGIPARIEQVLLKLCP